MNCIVRIIAVDDEQWALKALIRSIGKVVTALEVKGFQNPSDALDYAREHPIDIAFLDIGMPEMDGLTLAKRLKEIHPRVNIIFVSAIGDYALEALHLHVSGYLLKPCSEGKIADEIANLRYAPVEAG